MLRALVHNKDRSLNLETKEGQVSININYRDIYPQTEDFFTAAVFSRLCYLDGETISEIFDRCVPGKNFNLGKLKDKKFWPYWGIEPDVFIEFENCNIIVEAKRFDGGGQYKAQVENEIEAYRNLFPISRFVYLFALGGVSEEFHCDVEILNEKWAGYAEVVPISWQVLYENIKKSYIENKHIKEDLLLAFELQGIRELFYLKDLKKNKFKEFSFQNHKQTIKILCFYFSDYTNLSTLSVFPKTFNYKANLEFLKWK